MRKQYDFRKSRRNPFAARLKRAVTIRLDEATIAYFRELADETGIGYQTLINSYLKDCAVTGRRPQSMKTRTARPRESQTGFRSAT